MCKKDCGYSNNLGLHRKRAHGLCHRQERLGYNGEIERGSKIRPSQLASPALPRPGDTVRSISVYPAAIKRKMSLETVAAAPGPVVKRIVSKAMPCHKCTGCTNTDCMKCKWCHDKKKYGGPVSHSIIRFRFQLIIYF